MKEELRAKATSTSFNAVGNFIMARSRIVLRRKEVMKLCLINSRTDAIKRLLNIFQNIFMLVMLRAFLACLETGSPALTHSSSRVILFLQGVAFFICNSTEGQHRFLVAPSTLPIPGFGQSNVSFCLRPKEIRELGLTFRKSFTSKICNDLAKSLENNTFRRKSSSFEPGAGEVKIQQVPKNGS